MDCLKRRRKELGMTQQDVANRLGVERELVSMWENGKVRIPDHRLASLENLSELPVSLKRVRGVSMKRSGTSVEPKHNVSYVQVLIYYRKKAGLTQEELAKYSGVQLARIRRMENGDIPVLGEEADHLSKVLKVNPEELSYPREFAGTFKDRMEGIDGREQDEWEMGELPGKKRKPDGYCPWCRKAHLNKPCNPIDLPEEVR